MIEAKSGEAGVDRGTDAEGEVTRAPRAQLSLDEAFVATATTTGMFIFEFWDIPNLMNYLLGSTIGVHPSEEVSDLIASTTAGRVAVPATDSTTTEADASIATGDPEASRQPATMTTCSSNSKPLQCITMDMDTFRMRRLLQTLVQLLKWVRNSIVMIFREPQHSRRLHQTSAE